MIEAIRQILKSHARSLPKGKKGILIMDNCPAHVDKDIIP
jgi:hypothetical protein